MKNGHTPIATLFIVLLAGAAMFTACNTPTSPASVDTAVPTQAVAQTAGCPSVEQMASMIVAELDQNCPRTREYRHWGEQNSCEKRTIGQMLARYDGCYSSTELKRLRIRISQMRSAASDEDSKSDDDNPRPAEE